MILSSALRPGRSVVFAALPAAIAVLLVLPGVASAHPLGNFTINHYAGIRIEPNRVELDVVIDEAEIPTFSERERIDTDGSGTISDAETEAERQVACGRLATSLQLSVDGATLPLTVEAAGLSFPPGAAGLATMRLVCEYEAIPPEPIAARTTIHYADPSNAKHLGWHEIVVTADGTVVDGTSLPTRSISKRLTDYPAALIPKPLAAASATIVASPGGTMVGTPCVPDAFSLAAPAWTEAAYDCATTTGGRDDAAAPAPVGAATDPEGGPETGTAAAPLPAVGAVGAVPGGVGSEISGLLETRDLTPPILVLSLLTAIALGAAHALTPGHGKTIMAAYLVGTRGTTRQALGLGLTVTASHTLGVLALAAVILAFHVIAPDSYDRIAGIGAGLIVVVIGGWLVVGQIGIRVRGHRPDVDPERADVLGHAHGGVAHSHGGVPHSHGGVPHSHGGVPRSDAWPAHAHDEEPPIVGSDQVPAPVSRRGLFALGLFGGLVPSINALVILLAALTTDRAAYGLVLVVAFGAGMAVVLTGIGLGLVHAGRWMGRRPPSTVPARLFRLTPAVTAVVILAIGLYVTGEAILGTPTL